MTAHIGRKRPKSPHIYVPQPLKRVKGIKLYPLIQKAPVDGLTDAGIWTDDNSEVIKFMTFKRGGPSEIPGKYRVRLEIKEL